MPGPNQVKVLPIMEDFNNCPLNSPKRLTLFSTIFSFLTAFIVLNSYFLLISPILACLGVTFGICCLVAAGSVLKYTGAGFALFVVGILIELIVIISSCSLIYNKRLLGLKK